MGSWYGVAMFVGAAAVITATTSWRIWMQRRATAKLLAQDNSIRCTYCGGTKFYEGPSGGMSTNVKCATPWCGHWFNDMGPFGLDDLHRAEPTASHFEVEMRKAGGAFRVE